MIPGLSLIGAGTDSCIVDSRNFPLSNNRTITMQDNCLIAGFYIRTSNNLDYGFGIYSTGQIGLITQNKFSNANAGVLLWSSDVDVYKNHYFNLRTGIYIYNSNSIVRKNDVYTLTNTGDDGIFIDADNSSYIPVIDSNYIVSSDNGIYKGPGTRSTIKNNEIKLVNGSDGIFIHSYVSDSNWVFNNTVYTNIGDYALYTNGSNHLQIKNNYSNGNFRFYAFSIGSNHKVINNVVTSAEGGVEAWGTQNMVFQHNDVWKNEDNYYGFTPDTSNLSVNPMVVNDDTTQGELDFHLQMFSPLIDAGDPTILDKDSTRSDIGLYGGPYGESYVYFDLPPRTPVNLTANVDSLIKLNWNKNTEADFSYYNIYRDTAFNFTVDSTKLIASVTDTFYYQTFPSNIETLYYKLTAMDNQGNESNPSEEVAVILVSVKNEWKAVNNYILYQNYPNPFNPSTKIGYKLKERGYVKLYVYDIKGELVSVLVNEVREAGYYEVNFDAGVNGQKSNVKGELASGVYIYQIMVAGENNIPVFSDIKKMVYVK
ncbi:MAG: right-handed parallel beta-helix repeat-containing protein [Ignavibacteriaceae bacterium]|nr:right-handed parallel beta-helix repeat-containing protein [Ignavibacteriaceae bacterium]